MIRLLLLLAASFLFISNGFAQSVNSFLLNQPIQAQRPALDITWTLEEVTDGSVPTEIVEDTREEAPNGLPDGRIEVLENTRDIEEAWFSEPTERYRHAVLGDGIEAGALKVRTKRGETYTFRLPRTEVFEDITPRLSDLDGDGTTEVIAILSSAADGASVAVFGLVGNAFIKKAQTPFIGRANRWLNIAGIDHYAGRRIKDIVVIETPHLAGLFKTYSFNPASTVIRTRNATPGFTNHQIGSRELRLSATAFVDGDRRPDLLIPSIDRQQLLAVSVQNGSPRLLSAITLPARIDKAIGVEGSGDSLKITVGLETGQVFHISR